MIIHLFYFFSILFLVILRLFCLIIYNIIMALKKQLIQKSRQHKLSKLEKSTSQIKKKMDSFNKQDKETVKEEKNKQINKQVKENIENGENQSEQLSLPTHFTVIDGIEPIYSGGKIQLSFDQANQVQIYSSYNHSIIKSSPHLPQKDLFKIQHVRFMQTIAQKDEEIGNFAISNSGSLIATFTKNYLLRILSNDTNVMFTQKIEPLFPVDMAFSPEDIFLALGGTTGTIRIINIRKQSTANEYRFHNSSVLKVVWVPIIRKLQLASAGDDQKIIIFDVVANRCLCNFNAHQARITSLNFTSNGNYLLSSSADQFVKVWDAALFKLVSEVELPNDVESLCVIKHKKRDIAIAGTLDGKLATFLTESPKDFQLQDILEGQEILKIMAGVDNKLYLVTNELHIYIATIDEHLTLTIEKCQLGYNDEVLDAKFYDNDTLILVTNSPFLKKISISNMEVLVWKAHDDIVMCVQCQSPYVYSGAKDNLIKVWENQQLIATLQGHNGNIVGISISSNLLASVSADNSLKLWDLVNIKNQVSQSKNSVMAHEKDINCVKFSPNRKMIATSSQDRKIKIWQASNLMIMLTLEGHKRGVWDVSFSPLEKVLASASGDNTVKIWNLDDGSVIASFEGHQSAVQKVMWLGYGLILLSADSTGVMKLWNVKKRKCVNTLEKHEGKVWALDGKDDQIVTGGNDSLVYIWKNTSEEANKKISQESHEKQIRLQEFTSLLRDGRLKDAALLAFDSNFTSHFIQAIQGMQEIELGELSKELMSKSGLKLLTLLNTLNQSNKTCCYAQQLFYLGVRQAKFEIKEDKDKIKQLLRQFKYTTEKYVGRIKISQRQAYLIEYTLDKNKMVYTG